MAEPSSSKDTPPLNPRTTKFEFGGVLGTTFLTVFLPIFTVAINLYLTPSDEFFPPFTLGSFLKFFNPIATWDTAWKPYLIWFGILALCDLLLPGKTVYGTQLRDGSRLKYRINGLSNLTLLILLLAVRYYTTSGRMPELVYLYTHHIELCLVTIAFSFYLATFCYIKSFLNVSLPSKTEKILAVGGNSGSPLYDWFIGRELNPRVLWGLFDIKLFCELRPGMLLWFLINLSCLHHHYLKTNQLNDALLLINALQAFYIFDGVLNEEGVLSMIDITTDGFGFMLAFGDLTFVPFTYSLQARFLSVYTLNLGPLRVTIILSLMSLGYYVFHSSNTQKSLFKQGKLPHLKSIQTHRGTKLLCDGWWAVSQHINYFGDWMMSLSWCLTTWFVTPVTYFYSVYFAILLIHRQMRDEEKCSKKYGADWTEYQRRVPYKIIPYVY